MNLPEETLYFCDSCGDDFLDNESLYKGQCNACREDKSESREW